MAQTKNRQDIALKEFVLKIRDWFKYLLSKWYVFVIAGVLGTIIGFFYAGAKKPTYTATTTFVLETGDQAGGMAQYAGMAALVGIDLGGKGDGIFQGDNLLELYKSRKMIEAALLIPSKTDTSKLLIDSYLQLTNARDLWMEKSPALLKIDFRHRHDPLLDRSRDSIIQRAVSDINKNNLVVGKLDKKLSIIKVDVKSIDEVFSKEFNEAIVDQVNTFYIKTKTKKSLDNIDILQHKTDSVRAVMNGSISVAASVADATPNLNPTRQAQRLIPTQRSQFSAETNKAILGQLVQNLEMSKMALMKEAPLIQVVDNPVFPLQKNGLSRLIGGIIGGILLLTIAFISLIFTKLFKDIFNEAG
ncbi:MULTISPECIES: lipopolysaccharide biosynthesis protein [unclassified Sphingobacterium]|uniref:lipopolysaccharide biosynthesis protein n=1 Tax=unclassified Sphingobacterium TaxID=2609468 RepID=UPI0025E7A32D|nr:MULTISPECIES: lipopolysaccharide biosynthesis protein [unclassified Sphingobacterium]